MKLEFREVGYSVYAYVLGRSYAVGSIDRMVHTRDPSTTTHYVTNVFPSLELFFTKVEARTITKALTEHGVMLNVKLRIRGHD